MGENFLLKWNDHSTSILSATSQMFQSSGLTDVTIGTSDRSFRAHKLVLSICSSAFAQLFGVNGALASQQNPYIYMQDVPSKHLETLLKYIYDGEVSVEEADLGPLLTSARGLGIKGLCEVENKQEDKIELHNQNTDPLLAARKRKRKVENNNFVPQRPNQPPPPRPPAALPLAVNGSGTPIIMNSVLSVTLPEPATLDEPGAEDDDNEDVIEVDTSKFEAGIEESIVAEEGIEEIPEEWLQDEESETRGSEEGGEMGGDRVLPCSFCPKVFNSNWHLKRHVMTHTRDTRYTCSVCHKDFSRNDNLKSHMKTIHGVVLPPKQKSK